MTSNVTSLPVFGNVTIVVSLSLSLEEALTRKIHGSDVVLGLCPVFDPEDSQGFFSQPIDTQAQRVEATHTWRHFSHVTVPLRGPCLY